jgi:hypothetical protein
MGEGLREETIVESAVGNGQDGDANCSPTGLAASKFFSLRSAPVIRGRTELYLNSTLLSGVEQAIDENSFSKLFDYRLDTETGCIELQGASIGDQDGKNYSASSINVGNGLVIDGTCGNFDLISVLDANAPQERWTARASGIVRDSNGSPVPGLTTFTVSGSVSGQLKNTSGQPYLFHDSYYTNTSGGASGSSDSCLDGFAVASSVDFGVGVAYSAAGDATPATTKYFQFSGDLVSQGQVLAGDELCVDGYVGIEITDLSYDSGTNKTTVTLKTDSLDSSITIGSWDIRATNLFVDDTTVAHDGITGLPVTAGQFSGKHIGKILMICSGDTTGIYRIDSVTSSRRIRVSSYSDSTIGFPQLSDGNGDGYSEIGLTFNILETNGVLLFGIKSGTVPYSIGDKFFIDVTSRVLKENDRLEAKYIAESDINDPELFISSNELFNKHGRESVTNTLSLGARLAFENGAPYVLTLQCKPPVARRTSVTLIEEVNTSNVGGFNACGGVAANCQPDDLTVIIPRPSGLGSGRPDSNTPVNIFVKRNGVESQIFPNKIPFYNAQYETPSGQNQFISSSDTSFSYTVINTNTKILGQGFNGTLNAADGTFSSPEMNFDGVDVGSIIVLQSVKDSGNNLYTVADDISTFVFSLITVGVELVVTGIVNDTTVTVEGNDISGTAVTNDAVDIQFFVKDSSNTTDVSAALLLHSDLVDSGAMQQGDGLRISYIDQTDADFFDTNWFEAFEALEAEECQMVIPVPLQNRSGIFRSAVRHCETMSTIAIQKERIAMFGAQIGLTTAALLGDSEVAIEDIGILEGIQGDSPEEILDGNTEDLVNYKLSDNFTSNRSVFFYPDEIVRSISGVNTRIDGFYQAAAAAGYFSGNQNVAMPLTNKVLSGFSILREKKFRPVILNRLGAVGATVLQPVVGGGLVLAGRTTSQSGFVEDEEISIMFIRDRVKQVLRDTLKPFVGTVENVNTLGVITSKVVQTMAALVSQGLITGFENVKVEKDKIDPRQWNVLLRFIPAYPINFAFVDLEVSSGV